MTDGSTDSRRLGFATLGLAVLAASTCRPSPTEDLDPGVVALVDGEEVTTQDLRSAYWAAPAQDRARIAQPGGRHHLLDLAIADVLLEREARARALTPSYSDLHGFHETLMQRFLEAEFEPTVRPEDVPDAVVRAEYERLAPGLALPHRRRLRVLAHDAPESAEAMIAELAAIVASEGLGGVELGIERGTIRTRYGQDGVFDLSSATTALGAEVAEAGFALDPASVVVDRPIPYRRRWGVVIVRSDLPAQPAPTFEEVADQLRRRLHLEARERALDELVESFRSRHEVERHEGLLDLVPWAASDDAPPTPSADQPVGATP